MALAAAAPARPSSDHQIVGHRVARLTNHLDQLPMGVRVLKDLVGDQTEGHALAAISTGSANAMHVRLDVVRYVVVHHHVDVVDVWRLGWRNRIWLERIAVSEWIQKCFKNYAMQ